MMFIAGRDDSRWCNRSQRNGLGAPAGLARLYSLPSLVYSAVSLTGVLLGFVAGVASFGVFYLGARRLMVSQSARIKVWLPLLYLVRYGLFALLVYVFLRLGLGDFWGLFVGVTVAIVGCFVFDFWQRHRTLGP